MIDVLSLRWSQLKENGFLSFAEKVPSLRMRRSFSCLGLLGVSDIGGKRKVDLERARMQIQIDIAQS